MPLLLPDSLTLPILPTDEVIVHRGLNSFVVPATNVISNTTGSVKYVGVTTGNPQITLDNFSFQFETATGNLRIRTTSGNETIKYWSWGYFSGMSNIPGPHNSNSLVVTTAYQNIGDPGALFVAERRFIEFTPSSVADIRAYQFEYLGWDDGAVDKIMLKLKGF